MSARRELSWAMLMLERLSGMPSIGSVNWFPQYPRWEIAINKDGRQAGAVFASGPTFEDAVDALVAQVEERAEAAIALAHAEARNASARAQKLQADMHGLEVKR